MNVLDARTLRDGARRPIPWDALDASALDAKKRRAVGATWADRYRQEHLAVGAFALLAQELAEIGCEPIVLSLVTRASADEVRHAEICRRYANALLGEGAVPARYRGLPKVPKHEAASRELRTLLHVVEMCCLSETVTGVYFTEMLARATNPAAHATIESLLEDEIDHGRVGWAYVAERARDRSIGGLAEALPELVARAVGRSIDEAARSKDEDDPAIEAFGYLGSATSSAVVRRALADVIVPGFESLGVDVRALKDSIAERGWGT
jgi:hypothetical protein